MEPRCRYDKAEPWICLVGGLFVEEAGVVTFYGGEAVLEGELSIVALLTPPIDRGTEIRCYMRDPDGHLIEVGQLVGRVAG